MMLNCQDFRLIQIRYSVCDFVSKISQKQLIFNLFVITLEDLKNKKSN